MDLRVISASVVKAIAKASVKSACMCLCL